MSKKNKLEKIIDIEQKDFVQDANDTQSGLCIKGGRPTSYRYNKDFPEFPYCASPITCLYKDRYGDDKFVCKYFNEMKKNN